jgi:hypothetical protein
MPIPTWDARQTHSKLLLTSAGTVKLRSAQSYLAFKTAKFQEVKLNAGLKNLDCLFIKASKEFKNCMAREIIEAMKSGETLRLASVVDGRSPKSSSPYSGILANSTVKDSQYVFTSWSRSEALPETGKHVSLRVTLESCTENGGLPRLVTNGWINGLFFFHINEGQTAVFPWPTSFAI